MSILDLPVEQFLSLHWQKRPRLIRQAIPAFDAGISAEDLAALACEPDVESRIVLRDQANPRWRVRHGPFESDDFAELPETNWTLLVQEVDRWVPEVAELLDHFRFLPNWRIDDVMVSYSAPGGGVGPHLDQYDVFLVQAGGRRKWRIGRDPLEEEQLVPDLELRILAEFDADEEWVLEPGDMLYLPPKFAHDGIALDPGMTFSIGFRAPSHQEILGMFLSNALESADPRQRYADPDLTSVEDPGEISTEALGRIRNLLHGLVSDNDRFERWVGCFLTEPKRLREEPEDAIATADSIAEALSAGAELQRCTVPRFAWVRGEGERVRLFVGGREYEVGKNLERAAIELCGQRSVTIETLGAAATNRPFLELLAELCNRGYLFTGG